MLKNYLKVALKVLMRRKFFTFISLFGIAFTLLVLLVVTSFIDYVFAAESPESRSHRLLGVYQLSARGPTMSSNSSAGYAFLEATLPELEGIEEYSYAGEANPAMSYLDGRRVVSELRRTDAAYWRIFDFQFLEGGPFGEQDVEQGRLVAVISAATREEFFQGEPALGKEIHADGQTFEVIGVVKSVPVIRMNTSADLWVPLTTAKSSAYRQEYLGGFIGLILAREEADLPRIKSDFQHLIGQVPMEMDGYETYHAYANTKLEEIAREFTDEEGDPEAGLMNFRGIVVGAMFLFMLLPAINLVNINLSRIMERTSEIGVRKAFGASSRTLVGQFVVENVVLTLIGGTMGYLMSLLVLSQLAGSGLFPHAVFTPNARVFGYGLLMAGFFGLFSGVYPAWKMSRLDPVEALGGRTR